ncbi:MAG: hypothetical protein DRQ51_01340 [Gammaproteobacteria bacterium]|nr:MAG: hypothetical protein DRQ51_01340 [Gammaproteobacteria bacterium]
MKTFDTHNIKITALSPIHIGANLDFNPTNYIIENEVLYSFDTFSLMNILNLREKEELDKIVSSVGDKALLGVQKFFKNQTTKIINISNFQIPVSTGINELYNKRIGQAAQKESNNKERKQKKVINALELERTAFNPYDNLPIIAGSSFKGALRTAILDGLNQAEPLKNEKESNQKLQERLLNYKGGQNMHQDPFRLIQISDNSYQKTTTEIDNSATTINFAINKKNKRSKITVTKASDMAQQFESITVFNYQAFAGSINIQNLTSIKNTHQDKIPQHSWNINELAKFANDFYKPILIEELKMLEDLNYQNQDNKWLSAIQKILQLMDEQIKNNQAFLIRIGRHSGAESVTLNGARAGKIKIQTPKEMDDIMADKPTTIWLASDQAKNNYNLIPFGWALVQIDNESIDENISKLCQNYHQDYRRKQQQKTHKLKKQQQIQQAHDKKLQEAEDQKNKEIQERENYINSLSPFERELEQMIDKRPNPTESAAVFLFNKLKQDNWDDEKHKKQVAQKIKQIWQDEKKWIPDFAGTNKQKKKIQQRCQEINKYL